MSLQCPTNISYHTSVEQKLKAKNAAKVYRYGTAKLRDVLREKCIIRAKEARQHSFNRTRCERDNFNQFMPQLSINEILRQELVELEHDIELQDAIYNELLEEANEWLAQDLESEENYLVNVAESQDLVCPICQLQILAGYRSEDERFNYSCVCNVSFFSNLDRTMLQSHLNTCIDTHEQKCITQLSFFINPLNCQLEALCENCDYFCSL